MGCGSASCADILAGCEMGGLRFGVDIEALASMIGTLKIQPPFEHPSSRWSRSLSWSSGPGYCISLFFQSRRKLLEFEGFFYVSHAGEQAGGAEAFCDEARHQSSDPGFLVTANQRTSYALAPQRFDLRHESVAPKPDGT